MIEQHEYPTNFQIQLVYSIYRRRFRVLKNPIFLKFEKHEEVLILLRANIITACHWYDRECVQIEIGNMKPVHVKIDPSFRKYCTFLFEKKWKDEFFSIVNNKGIIINDLSRNSGGY